MGFGTLKSKKRENNEKAFLRAVNNEFCLSVFNNRDDIVSLAISSR